MRWTAEKGSPLAIARREVHNWLDTLWSFGNYNRTKVYQALAILMDMPRDKCHIGMFNIEQCSSVVDLVKSGKLKCQLEK